MGKDSAPTNNIDDAYREFEARLREESKKVNVSIRSPYLLDEDTTRLTSQIQQVIQEELAKNNQAKLQSFKERLQASKKSPIEESLPSPIEEREVNVMLEGLNLPKENNNRLTSQIQQMIEEELAKNAEARQEAGGTCICAGVGGPPGDEFAIYTGTPVRETRSRFMRFNDRYFREDSWDITINATENLPITTMYVSLELNLKSNWSKEIWVWDACRQYHPGVTRVYCKNNNSGYASMRLHNQCYGGQTLVFRKPKEFGIWYDMYHLYHSPREFWHHLGGSRVSFTWIEDDRY
jgi:hypothetical protein